MMASNDKEIWVFLSHSLKDFEKVRRVRNILEEQNLRPLMFFLKCLEDNDSQELDNLIKREIDCRTRFILCDSPNARSSTWVQREIDYIKSKEKPYEVIDLSKSDEEIKDRLLQATRKMRIFISYSMADYEIAKAIHTRLSKYDIFTKWFDKYELLRGSDFTNYVSENLIRSINDGFVICLLSNSSLRENCYTYEELRLIDSNLHSLDNDFKNNIVPIYLGENILSNGALQPFPHILALNDFVYDGHNLDRIIDDILVRILSPGNLLTYASNFENGIEKDLEEAERLKRIYFHLAEKANEQNTPTGIRALGRCYEFGIGTPIDLGKAYKIYSDHASTDGLCIEDAKRVFSALHPLQEEVSRESIWSEIASKIKKLYK